MLNNPPPSPTNNIPLIWLFTTKPLSGETDAVAEPDIILSNCKSSSASNGILYNPAPSPLYKDAVIDSETCNEPLSSTLTEPELIDESKFSTLKNPSGSTDAVTEPVNIFDVV